LGTAAFLGIVRSTCAFEPGETILKRENFDKDPNWEGFNNRVVPKHRKIVNQDFGYSPTNHAGHASGELGGKVQRSTTPAYYAAGISPKSLNDHITASGSFAITACQGGAGLFFGFFNSDQPGGSGRPIGSLGFDFDFEASGGRLAARLITSGNKSCGTFLTPYLPGKFRPTTLKADGTRYHWTLDYNPNATASGNGQFTVTLTSETHQTEDYGPLPEASQREAAARFPNTTKFVIDLPPGLRQENATFDRFGLLNMMKAGGTATIYFDDLRYNDETQDLTHDPGWIGAGNRTTFEDLEQVGAHNFGYSPKTNIAGGAPGEVGGGLWRSGDYAYYADRVGPLGLNNKLEVRGKVHLVTAGPDSDILLGWFNSESKETKVGDDRNFVGIHIGGPTRIGHYFNPYFANAKGSRGKVEKGPIIVPGKTYNWSLVYDPAANHGNGELKSTLGDQSATLALKPGQKKDGANLDRFGFFTTTIGGQMVKIYFDDLEYTAAGAVH
jgi:hypothetical protein